jgi:hypothetical protein
VSRVVYLSGPITGIEDYRERFSTAEDYVRHLGEFKIVNPADLPAPYGPASAWADWMINDLQLLRGADVMVILPDSEKSSGCAIELIFAKGLKIPTLDLAAFREWAARASS